MTRVDYQVTPDDEQLRDAIRLFELVGGNTPNAIRVAINKTGPKIRTKASKEIRSQVRLKAGYVGKRLKFVRARARTLQSSSTKMEGRITTPSRGVLLSRFSTDSRISGDKVSWIKPPDEPARGIKVKVKPRGGTKAVSGDGETVGKPFYMALTTANEDGTRSKTGKVGIAARRATKGPRGGKIKVFHGPSLSQVFTDVKEDVLPEADEEYTGQLIDAMRFLLTKEYPL